MKNTELKYIKEGKKIGRPSLNLNYVFSNERYLRIILFIYSCEKKKKNPTFSELQYTLAKKINTNQYDMKRLKEFFDIKIPKGKISTKDFYKKIISKFIIVSKYVESIIPVMEYIYNNEFSEGKIDFDTMIDKFNKLSENLKEQPFENWNDLKKYIYYLIKLKLITPDGKQRYACYKLTFLCKKKLKELNGETKKSALIQRIKCAPYGLIDINFDKIMKLLDKYELQEYLGMISPKRIKINKDRVILIK